MHTELNPKTDRNNKTIPPYYYAFRQKVLRGEIVVNKFVAQHMEHIDELILRKDVYCDPYKVEGFIAFVENELCLSNGDDVVMLDSFKLWAEDLLSWYHYPIERVWNSKIKDFEERPIKRQLRNEQDLIVGRGAAKSMYAAFMQAYFLVVDPTSTHQIVVAPTITQTNETTQPITTAIARKKGPLFQFADRVQNGKQMLRSGRDTIHFEPTNSYIEARPLSIDKLQGLKNKVSTVDEWLSGKLRENPLQAIAQGSSKIDDWVLIATSSEGTVRDGVGDDIKMDLLKILNGERRDDSKSIWYYRLDDLEEVNDPAMWEKANPNLGATTSYTTYQREVDANLYGEGRNDLLAKRFGIPVEGSAYFFSYEETLPHPPFNTNGMSCFVGADLSQADDFTAFTFLFPDGDRFWIKTRSYALKSRYNKLYRATQNLYDKFIAEGSLILMDDQVLDMKKVYDDLYAHIMESNYYIQGLGYDPYNSVEFLAQWVQDFGEYNVDKVRQGALTESVPIGELKQLAAARALIFDEALMKFAMMNAITIEDNNGNRKLQKRRNDEKIDNVAALLDAWVIYKRTKEK